MSIDRPRLREKYVSMESSQLVDEYYYWLCSLQYWRQQQKYMHFHELSNCLVTANQALEDNLATVKLIEEVLEERC